MAKGTPWAPNEPPTARRNPCTRGQTLSPTGSPWETHVHPEEPLLSVPIGVSCVMRPCCHVMNHPSMVHTPCNLVCSYTLHMCICCVFRGFLFCMSSRRLLILYAQKICLLVAHCNYFVLGEHFRSEIGVFYQCAKPAGMTSGDTLTACMLQEDKTSRRCQGTNHSRHGWRAESLLELQPYRHPQCAVCTSHQRSPCFADNKKGKQPSR